MQSLITAFSGLIIVIGVIGTIVPMLPGLIVCWAGVLLWAVLGGAGWGAWVVFGVVTVVWLAGVVGKYMWPGRRLKQNGIPNLSLFLGGVAGIAGFFLIPVVGLIAGFVLGVWLAELLRLQDGKASWASTKHALKAAGASMLIELGAAMTILAVWVVGLIAT